MLIKDLVVGNWYSYFNKITGEYFIMRYIKQEEAADEMVEFVFVKQNGTTIIYPAFVPSWAYPQDLKIGVEPVTKLLQELL